MIHVAQSEGGDRIRPSLGLFDLMDPVSALYFGQFILGCHSQFASVERLSKDRDTRELCWRLDHIHHDALSYWKSPSKADSFVETWVRDLPSTANAGYVLYGSQSRSAKDYHPDYRSFIAYAQHWSPCRTASPARQEIIRLLRMTIFKYPLFIVPRQGRARLTALVPRSKFISFIHPFSRCSCEH